MAYIKQHIEITFTNLVNGLDELAQTSLKVTTLGGAAFDAGAALAAVTTAQAQALLNAFYDLLSHDETSWRWADYSKIDNIKLAAVGVDGLYLTEPVVHADTISHIGGVAGIPAQCSIVLSLRSGLHIGVANYGRMFLPHMAWDQISDSPYAPGSEMAPAAAAAATFIGAVNTIANTWVAGAGVVLLSFKGAAQPKPVAQVALLPLTETQRRRMHQLPASYTFHNV